MAKTRKNRLTRRRRRTRNRWFGRGGGSCSARPVNSNSFSLSQRGGVAPFGTSSSLLDPGLQVLAQDGSQIAAIQEAQMLAQGQSGGHSLYGGRRSRRRRERGRRGFMKGGGELQEYSASYDYGFPNQGTNPQFLTEGSVNPQFGRV